MPHWQSKYLSLVCLKLLGVFIAAENKDILKFSTDYQFSHPIPNFSMVREIKVIISAMHLQCVVKVYI